MNLQVLIVCQFSRAQLLSCAQLLLLPGYSALAVALASASFLFVHPDALHEVQRRRALAGKKLSRVTKLNCTS